MCRKLKLNIKIVRIPGNANLNQLKQVLQIISYTNLNIKLHQIHVPLLHIIKLKLPTLFHIWRVATCVVILEKLVLSDGLLLQLSAL